jgi:hypothetical protein
VARVRHDCTGRRRVIPGTDHDDLRTRADDDGTGDLEHDKHGDVHDSRFALDDEHERRRADHGGWELDGRTAWDGRDWWSVGRRLRGLAFHRRRVGSGGVRLGVCRGGRRPRDAPPAIHPSLTPSVLPRGILLRHDRTCRRSCERDTRGHRPAPGPSVAHTYGKVFVV